MNQVNPQIRKIAIVSAVIAIVAFVSILLIFGIKASELIPAILRAGGTISLTAGFWVLYNRWLWRIKVFRLGNWLSSTPNLNGRWEGTVRRSEGDEPHPFVIEVVQTFSSIRFQTFSRNSRGNSTAVAFNKVDGADLFEVVATWQTTTQSLKEPGTEQTFQGVSRWQLVVVDKPGHKNDRIKIVDHYFTNRHTTGRVDVRWTSKQLRNGFE